MEGAECKFVDAYGGVKAVLFFFFFHFLMFFSMRSDEI